MMDWEFVLAEIVSIVARIIITVCIPFAMKMLMEKIHNDKVNEYIEKAQDVVIQCVDFVNQTYVDGLKAEGKFDKDCQYEAFKMSKNYVMEMLNDEAKKAIIEVFGDIALWTDSMIESSVRSSVNHSAVPVIEEGVLMEDED